MITGKEMEKLKIIPPDAQIYAQIKASWDKIAKPEAAAFPLKKK